MDGRASCLEPVAGDAGLPGPSTQGGGIGLGLCHWCQRQPTQAIATWKDGLDAVYTDAVGGVEVPALLLYAALRTQDTALQNEMWRLLRKHARRKQLVNWPGAIVAYLLGKFTTEELRAAAHWPSAPAVLLERHQCQVSFYVGVRGLLDQDISAFQSGVRACAASWYGYLEQEYYLATWEVEHAFPIITSDEPHQEYRLATE